jgi:RNA polymerase sigma factor (TIGR02999 family)
MSQELPGEWTLLLQDLDAGNEEALQRLLPVVYGRLRELAEVQLRREQPGHTLNPTGLVHEAYLKLAGPHGLQARDRAHFLALASRAMRQVLVDHARTRRAGKRGGGLAPATLVDGIPAGESDPDELLALAEALGGLDPRQRQVVECRFFGGMEESEIAAALGVTERTIRRDWVKARAWLYGTLYGGAETSSGGEPGPSLPVRREEEGA